MAKNQRKNNKKTKTHVAKSTDEIKSYVQHLKTADDEGYTDKNFVSESENISHDESGTSVGCGERQRIDPETGDLKEKKKNDFNYPLLGIYVTILIAVISMIAMGYYRFGVLETKVENSFDKLAGTDNILQNLSQKTDDIRERLVILEERLKNNSKNDSVEFANEIESMKKTINDIKQKNENNQLQMQMLNAIEKRITVIEETISGGN